MLSMTSSTRDAHVALYDTLADLEIGHLVVELRTGRFTSVAFEIVTVAETPEPITTMGGLRIVPDMVLADLDPAASDLLILAGADMWDNGGGRRSRTPPGGSWTEVPVAAICGATAGLAGRDSLTTKTHQRGGRVPRRDRILGRRTTTSTPRGRRRGSHHRWPAVTGAVRQRNPRRLGLACDRRRRRTSPCSTGATRPPSLRSCRLQDA